MNKSNFRTGHLEGKCDVVFSPDEKYVLTCGSDSLVQKWDVDILTKEDSQDGEYEAKTVYEHKDGVTCIAVSKTGDKFATGSADHHVNLFLYPSCSFETTLTRAQLDIRHLAFSPDGTLLVVAGEDSTLRLVNLIDSSINAVLKGHEGPIRSVAYDPKGDYIASAGTDGTVKIWNLKERAEEKSLAIIPKGEADRQLQLTRIDWHPKGDYLAVPTPAGIHMVKRGSWEIAFTLEGEHKKEGANIFRWSPDGRLGASAGLSDFCVLIWDMEKKETVDKLKYTSGFMGLDWSSSSKSLVMISEDGKLNLWEGVNAFLNSKSRTETKKGKKPVEEEKEEKPEITKDELLKSMFLDEEAEEDDVDEEEAEEEEEGDNDLDDIFAEDEKRELKKQAAAKKKTSSDDADEPQTSLKDKMGKLQEKRRLKKQVIIENEGEDDDVKMLGDDDLDDEIVEYVENENGNDNEVEEVQVISTKSSSSKSQPTRSKLSQPTFQPNSSPTSDSKRFFAWTLFGSICSYSDSSIEIQFSNQLENKNIHISNVYNFTMGAMGQHGVLLAAKSSNEGYPSNILYRPFNSWATNSEWSANMPPGEEVEAIAVGKGWAAVATTRSWLRLFSYSGVQTALMKLPGRVVCMTGYNDLLSVVYHKTNGLELVTLDMYTKKTIIKTALPIDGNANLTWIGYSEEGVLLLADSAGYVYGLFPQFDWHWTPLIDFYEVKKNKHEGHWIIGLTEDQLIYVSLAPGAQSPPVTASRPPTQCFTVSIPVLRDTDLRLDEEKAIRANLYYALDETMAKLTESLTEEKAAALQKVQAKCDSAVILMIRQAIQAKEQVKALDLAGMLHLPKSLTIAKYLAEESNMRELGKRIEQLFEAKKILVQSKKDFDDRQKLLDSLVAEKRKNPSVSFVQQPQQQEREKEREEKRRKDKEKEEEEEKIRSRKYTPIYDSDAETMADENGESDKENNGETRQIKKRKIAKREESEGEEEEEDSNGNENEEEEEEETRGKKDVEYFNPFAVVKKVDEIDNNRNASKSLFSALGQIQSKIEKEKQDSAMVSAKKQEKKEKVVESSKKKKKASTTSTTAKKATGSAKRKRESDRPAFGTAKVAK